MLNTQKNLHESELKRPNYLGHLFTFHERARSLLVKLADAGTYVSS